MDTGSGARTAELHGPLWGARARDWAEVQEPLHLPVYLTALERAEVGPATRYLDIGCGAGLAAELAAARGAVVAGLDAAEGMLAIARARLPQGDFRRGDMEALPFGDAAFDVVTGINSLQYAGSPGTALAEAARVTRPGGTVVVVTWGEPEGMDASLVTGALEHLVPPPAPGAPGPFGLSDAAALRGFAEAAGLAPVELVDVEAPWVYPDAATALRGLGSTGVAARAVEVAGWTAVAEAYRAAIALFRQEDGSYRIGATFRCLLARR